MYSYKNEQLTIKRMISHVKHYRLALNILNLPPPPKKKTFKHFDSCILCLEKHEQCPKNQIVLNFFVG